MSELDKYRAQAHKQPIIQEFLDWLMDESGLSLRELVPSDNPLARLEWGQPRRTREQIIADFMGIDLRKFREEKHDALMREIEALNSEEA